MKVLIIDDAKAMRLILRQILTSLGFEVREAGNGREGLDQLRQSPDIELALIDFYLPDMEGVEFVRTLRHDPVHDPVQLLLVTSENEPTKIDMALRAGANGYLQKPFGRHDVLEKIRGLGFAPCCA